MARLIRLKEATPIAKGKNRFVFQHPHEASHLIKVIRPEVIEKRYGSGAKWYKRLRRYGKYMSYRREIQEFLVAHKALEKNPRFLQQIIGFEETDYGLGLVVEAVTDSSGKLAPTIRQLIYSDRMEGEISQALELCFEALLESPVVVSDLTVDNLVYLDDGNYFAVIDGMGNSNPLAPLGFSQVLNRRAKRRRIRRLRQKMDLHRKMHSEKTNNDRA